jgi:hypothetical protein
VLSFREKDSGSQALLTRSCSTEPMAEMEASVTSANGEDGSGCARRVVRDKFSLQSENAWRSVGVQGMG